MSGDRIGELLVRQKLISLQQLRKAQEEQRREGTSLGYALAKMGFVSDKQITEFLSQQYRVQAVDLREYEIDPEVLKLIPHEMCERHRILPVSRAGSSLIVAMADPSNLNAIDDIKFTTGYNVEPVVASEAAIMEAIDRYYNQETNISYDEIMEGFDETEIEFAEDDGDGEGLDLERGSVEDQVVRLFQSVLVIAL
jgi:type IV pilus assembly protein PilB